jgi:gamma-glutamyltranspeptidase / glutathione hydrolase
MSTLKLRSLFAAITLPLLVSCSQLALQPANSRAPEAATGEKTQHLVQSKTSGAAQPFMSATANPYATRAADQILRDGGSAVDAAIAAQLVLTLVEPQSSGIGGGAFLMHYDNATKHILAYDGRETAPESATEALFLKDGKPLAFFDAVVGGRSVGVPGVVDLLARVHNKHGKLPWAKLFAPAIGLASDGFNVSPRLNALLTNEVHLRKDPVAAAYFYDASGKPWPVGHELKNPALASTLKRIAELGPRAFYEGALAKAIVEKVRNHTSNPGGLSETDMASYKTVVRQALCGDFAKYKVCGFPPPSSGGIAVAQILATIEAAQAPALADTAGNLQAGAIHLFSEAGRLAFADRGRYIADPDFVDWPRGLLNADYLKSRAALIKSDQSLGRAQPGTPPDVKTAFGDEASFARPATSHLSIVDAAGNAVSMTTTIEDGFGSRLMIGGFLLNNQLTDFSFAATDNGAPVANRVQPGKRPRSSMAPVIAFDAQNRLALVTGSPGGSLIINYVAKVLVASLRDGLDIQSAISLPNFGSRNGPTELEKDKVPVAVTEALQKMGHEVRAIDMTSGLQGIRLQYSSDGKVRLSGGADPRREGLVLEQ